MLLTAYGIPEEVNVSKTRLMKNTIEELFFLNFGKKRIDLKYLLIDLTIALIYRLKIINLFKKLSLYF